MKALKKINLILLVGMFAHTVVRAQTTEFTQEQINFIAQAIFNPTLASYPTTSVNEKAVEALYGSGGLNVGEPLLTYIKKFYFYIEYLTRIELAAQLITAAKDQGLTQFTQAVFSWNDLIAQISKAVGAANWQELLPTLRTTTPDWNDFRDALGLSLQYDLQDKFNGATHPVITFNDLLQTSFWTALPITAPDIIASNFWQNYLKFTLYGTFQIDNSLTKSIDFNQNLIFKYIPRIEMGYYEPDFTELRNQNELLRVSLVLNESYRQRLKNQTVDWNKLPSSEMLTAAQNFINTQFYQIARAATDVSDRSEYSPYTVDAQGNIRLKSQINLPSPYPEYMTCLGMIMMLQKLTYTLFEPKGTDVDALTNTVRVLKRIPTKPAPNFLVYDEQDYLALEDLTTIIQMTVIREAEATPPQAVTPQAVTPPSITTISSADDERVETAGAFGEIVGNIIDAIGAAAKDAWATVKDAVNVIKDEAEVFYYSSGAAEAIAHLSPEAARDLSNVARDAAKKDWDKFREDADQTIKDSVKVASMPARTVIDAVLGVVDQAFRVLNLPESDLQSDFDKVMDAAVDVVTDALTLVTDLYITQAKGVVTLTTDGAALLTKVATDLAQFQTKNLGADLARGVSSIVDDALAIFIESLQVSFQDLKKLVNDVFTLAASIVQILTDMLIDIISFTADIASALLCVTGDCDPKVLGQETAQFLENHKALVSQIVATGLLIGATVATGGGALAIGALAGFGAFSIVGGYQQDEDAIHARAEQKEFLDNYTAYIINKEQIDRQQQVFVTDELTKKFGAEINNRERSLGFYQNYLNDTLGGIRNQLNRYIGTWQAALLTPDKTTGLVYADIGSLYGYSTGFYDLNISQGFSLYSPSRTTISQEIAETPRHTITNPTPNNQQLSNTKFWFNQRITQDLATNTDPLEVEVRFQALYLLNSFYVGLYLGGSPLDRDAILKQNIGNLDQPHLAKMFVYSKEGKDIPISLGLYEFETQQPNAPGNWLATNLPGPAFSAGAWYRMKAQLSGNTLHLKVWQEGQPEPEAQTFTVTPCPQQTFGMVFSGAAGEFQVISPAQTFTQVRKPTPITSITEKERELGARCKLKRLLAPQNFAMFNLSPISFDEIIKGHYLYQLPQAQTTDYVTTGRFVTNSTLDGIGQEPILATNALVSLVSGKGYQNVNDTLQENGWAMNIATIYKNTFTNVSNNVESTLDKAITDYAQAMMGPTEGLPFGTYKLRPIDLEAVKNHQFIYLPVGKGPVLKYQERVLTDDAGNPLTDSYFVFTLIRTLGANKIPMTEPQAYFAGMSYQDVKNMGQKLNQPVCILSLVTGNAYVENQDTPVATDYIWDSYIGKLPKELQNTIQSASAAYIKAKQAKPTPNETGTKPTPSTDKPTGGGTDTSTGTIGFHGGGSGDQTADESFRERQGDAGGGEFGP